MNRLYKFLISLAFSAPQWSLKLRAQSLGLLLIFLSMLWTLPAHSQYTCKALDPIPTDQIAALTCEMKRSQICTSFFNHFTPDFQKKFGLTCPDIDEGHLFKTTTICGGLTLASGLSVWQTLSKETKTAIAQKVPSLLQKFGPRLLPYLSVFGSVVTIYSVTDILNESIKQDKKCFENIDKKQATIDFLEATSNHLLKRTKGLIDEVQTRQLRLADEYKQPKFIENLPCQQLTEIVLIQKKKQDEILGKLIATGKLKSDPRKELALTDEEMSRTKFLLENMACLSPQRRVELLCALGNTAMGGIWLKGILGNISTRPQGFPSQLKSGANTPASQGKSTLKEKTHFNPEQLSETQKRVIKKIEAQTDKLEAAVKACGHSLTSNICRGASGTLKELLEAEGISVTPMRNMFHTFLRVDNFYGPGKHLIVDPTYRQFIRGTFTPEDPKIFIGTEQDLLNLLKKREMYKPSDYFEDLQPDPGVPSML